MKLGYILSIITSHKYFIDFVEHDRPVCSYMVQDKELPSDIITNCYDCEVIGIHQDEDTFIHITADLDRII